MTALRRLNENGIRQFAAYLQEIRNGAPFHASPAILHVDEFSSPVSPLVHVEPVSFRNKFEAAKELAERLRPLGTVASDPGLWSWLALYYFDQLSPAGEDGRRRPRQNYHYIPSNESGWYADRHLLAGPYKLYLTHGEYARLLLYPRVHEHGAFVYDLGHRRELISNRGLIEAIDILYWDPKRNRPKRGATSSNQGGTLRRLIAVLQQLDFNYDLFGMSAQEILALLPDEFDPWKPAPLLRG
jgi:hypothetical protein